MTGDFNTPSHLDWTPAADAVREDIRYPVAWPVTRALAAAGFQDAYRAVHPDPVANPGITWTFGYPFPRVRANEVVDRIDLIQASGGVQVLDAGIAGPAGTPDVTVPVDPYPSDHRGVVAGVRLVPAAPPSFASVLDRRVERGDPIPVRYAAPRGGGREHLAIVRAGGRPGAALMTLPPQEATLRRRRDVRLGRAAARPLRRAPGRRARPRALAQHVLGRAARRAAADPRAPPGPRRARDPHRLAQRARLPARLGRRLEGRRSRPLQRLPDVRLHRRDRGRRDAHRGRPRGRSRPAATSPGCSKDDGYGVLAQTRFTVAPR